MNSKTTAKGRAQKTDTVKKSPALNDVVMPKEASVLLGYHTSKADYYLACKQSNVENANTIPVYAFGDMKTKDDWLSRAKFFDEKRKFHRKRARIFLTITEA